MPLLQNGVTKRITRIFTNLFFIETKTLKTLTLYVSGFSALYDAMHLFFLENKLLDKNISISSLSPTEPSHTQ